MQNDSNIIISPSMLSCNFGEIAKECKKINESPADWFHLDIMDGTFVPNISFGLPIVAAIKKYASKPLDVHLMIIHPENYIGEFKKAGADILTVHYEACTHLHRTISQIKENDMKAGVSINPHTPVSVLHDIIKDLDLVLIMSVNPGFGGQKFIENSYRKIQTLKELISKENSKAIIEVDGGVTDENSKKLKESGAQALVAGSWLFKQSNFNNAVERLKNT